MASTTFSAQNALPQEENHVRELYQRLLDSWNQRDGHAFAILFEVKGHLIGYDGSQINGRTAIQKELDCIFYNHIPAVYVAKVREVRFPTPDTAILRAVAGMVPRGQTEINSGINAMQTLVAVKRDSGWQIALFQNTPVQFHDRQPDLAQQITEELSLVLKDSKIL